MSRTIRVSATAETQSSTSEHPDKRRSDRTLKAYEYNKKINGSTDVSGVSFKDILEISAEGRISAANKKSSNWQPFLEERKV